MNNLANANILIVDDDTDFRDLLKNILDQLPGVQTQTADNAMMALVKIHAAPPQILITDTNMPGPSGIDLLKMVKKHSPETLVIVLFSGLNGSNYTTHDVIDLGADMAVTKQAIKGKLIPFVEAWLGIDDR